MTGRQCMTFLLAAGVSAVIAENPKVTFDEHGCCEPVKVVVDRTNLEASVPERIRRRLKSQLAGLKDGDRLEIDIGRIFDQSQGYSVNYPKYVVPLDAEGRMHGEQRFYKPWQHQPIASVPWQHGKRHGVEKAWTGVVIKKKWRLVLVKEIPWQNGRIHGTKKLYSTTGKLKFECTFVKGRQQGEAKSYAPNGKLSCVTRYKDGAKQGRAVWYHPGTNIVKREVVYVDDRINGATKEFFPNGKLKRKMQVKDSVMHGVVEMYAEDGRLIRKSYFLDGEGVTEAEFKQKHKP